jgi:hypothetical protein
LTTFILHGNVFGIAAGRAVPQPVKNIVIEIIIKIVRIGF